MKEKTKKTKIFTKSLVPLKQKLAKALNRGKNNISFKSEAFKLITDTKYNSIYSHELKRDLLKEKGKYLTLEPKKRKLYKVHRNKKSKVKKLEKIKAVPKKPIPEFVKAKIDSYNKLRAKLKIKDIYKDHKSQSYLKKRKIISDKDLHMDKIRKMRKTLKSNKALLNNKEYRMIYKRIKGNYFTTQKKLQLELERKLRNVQ